MLELIFISGEEGAALFPLKFLPRLLFDFETGRDQVPEEIKAAAAAAAATAIVAFFHSPFIASSCFSSSSLLLSFHPTIHWQLSQSKPLQFLEPF